MSDDILDQLRTQAKVLEGSLKDLLDQACDEIEHLREQHNKIVGVYTTVGVHPEYHQYLKSGLKKDWPALFRALEQATDV